MGLNVLGSGLEFSASLDANDFDAGIKKVTDDLTKVTNEAAKTGEEFNKNFSKKLTSSFDDVSKSSGAGTKAIGSLVGSVTSLINPTALITAGLTAAAVSIYKYASSSSEAAKAQKILNDVISGAAKDYGKTAGKIDLLKDKLNDLSIPLKERAQYAEEYNKIADASNQIDTTQLNNLAAINPKIEQQIKLFRERSLARAAENVVSQKAEVLFKAQLDFDTKFPELNAKTIDNLRKNASDAIDAAKKKFGVNAKINANELLNFADLPDSELQELAKKNEKFKILLDERTKNILVNVNRQLQAVEQYKKGTKAGGGGAAIYQNLIDQAQKDLDQTINIASGLVSVSTDAILGGTGKTAVKKDPKEDSTNRILEERKNLLDQIDNLQRDASQSGLTKEQSELDKINEKYDLTIAKLQDYNNKKDAFNKKNPSANIPGFADADFAKLQAAKNIELANTTQKQEALKYIQTIAQKKDAFDKFEAYQSQHLGEKASEIYKNELNGFTSYLDFINSEIKRITSLPQTVGTVNELNALEKTRLETIQSEGEKTRAKAIQDYKNLLDATRNFYTEKQAINESYDAKEKTLQSNQTLFSVEDYKMRLKALQQGREDELKNLNDNLFYQTEAYRLMNTNVLNLTKEGGKKIVTELNEILQKGFSLDPITGLEIELTPEQLKAIEDVIRNFKEVNKQLSTFAGLSQEDVKKIEDYGNLAADSFHKLGDAISQTNESLGATINSLGDVTQVATDAFSAVTKFASGDIIGGVQSTVGAIVGVLSIGAKSRESQRKAEAELKEYTDAVLKGQIDYNALLREQERSQTNINELTNQELITRQKLLDTQKQQAQADYDRLLNQIAASGKQIIDEHTEKYGGILGIGRKTKVVQDLAGISNADFEALQKLSSENKLDEETQKWFEALKKVHDELQIINEDQQEQARQTAERATATTADAITDSILQGFANGQRATQDFADNFQELMRNSILNSFKYQALQVPLQKFYSEFAAAAESDNTLSLSEIQQLQQEYNSIITNAGKQFDQLTQLTKVDLTSNTTQGNSLTGAVRGITETQADLLAAQFGGLRISALSQLQVAQSSLLVLNKIEFNTALIKETNAYLRKFDQQGIKIQ